MLYLLTVPFCLLQPTDSAIAIQVSVLNPFNVAILFQPVTLQCNYQTSATQPPIVLWKYKSYCRSRIADAFNPGSQESQLNNQLQTNNPGYNPYVECQDNSRTVRVVATKQGNTVTLGEFYQGRRITITNGMYRTPKYWLKVLSHSHCCLVKTESINKNARWQI